MNYMEDKVLIFVIATVVIVAVILGLTLPPLLRKGKDETDKATSDRKSKSQTK
jgi:NADH:ubiquinone oxidoreductase subunit 3 (subunit A)